jgi:hypothetical protein
MYYGTKISEHHPRICGQLANPFPHSQPFVAWIVQCRNRFPIAGEMLSSCT